MMASSTTAGRAARAAGDLRGRALDRGAGLRVRLRGAAPRKPRRRGRLFGVDVNIAGALARTASSGEISLPDRPASASSSTAAGPAQALVKVNGRPSDLGVHASAGWKKGVVPRFSGETGSSAPGRCRQAVVTRSVNCAGRFSRNDVTPLARVGSDWPRSTSGESARWAASGAAPSIVHIIRRARRPDRSRVAAISRRERGPRRRTSSAGCTLRTDRPARPPRVNRGRWPPTPSPARCHQRGRNQLEPLGHDASARETKPIFAPCARWHVIGRVNVMPTPTAGR